MERNQYACKKEAEKFVDKQNACYIHIEWDRTKTQFSHYNEYCEGDKETIFRCVGNLLHHLAKRFNIDYEQMLKIIEQMYLINDKGFDD